MARQENIDINRYLTSLGISPRRKGYLYLFAAIQFGVSKPQAVYKLGDIYKSIAMFLDVDAGIIDNTIRYSLLKSNISQSSKEFIARAIFDLKYTDLKTSV